MFLKPLVDNKIPLNFLDSILSNNALYEMFKCDFEQNRDYFKGIPKDEYLFYMLEYIISKLLSGNFLDIYEETKSNKPQVIENIKKFIDDYFIENVNKDRNSIVATSLFKALDYCLKNDSYAKDNKEFIEFYHHVIVSCDYDNKYREIKDELDELLKKEKLSISEFELLCNFVKNNRYGYVEISVVGAMLNLHAYKKNHIFDREVVKVLVYSTVRDYFLDLDIDINIEYIDDINFENKTYDASNNTIYIESLLLDTFISGNYVELFNNLFYKMKLLRDEILLTRNGQNIETLHVIMNMINQKVDLNRIYTDNQYEPYSYYSDIKSSSFVSTLKFYQSFGIDLFLNYINTQINNIPLEGVYAPTFNKEISIDITFDKSFNKLSDEERKRIIKKYAVLRLFYFDNGKKKNALDLISTYLKKKDKCILEYMETAVLIPEEIINNAVDVSTYDDDDEEVRSLVDRLLKFIYQDLFYYSLQHFIMLNSTKQAFNKGEYLDELYVKVKGIKTNNKLDRFVSDILNIIEIEKQN